MVVTKYLLLAILLRATFADVSTTLVDSDDRQRPENQVLLLGNEFVWPCKINNDQFPANSNPTTRIVWTHEKRFADSIYVDGKVLDSLKDKFEVIVRESSDTYTRKDLRFKEVSMDEADLYYCVTGLVAKRGYSANIIVADPKETNCDIFPPRFIDNGLAKKGDSILIICQVVYKTHRNCRAKGFWQSSWGEVQPSDLTSEGKFKLIVNIDENFINSTSYNLTLRFSCQGPQNEAKYSTVEPTFETGFVTPLYYFQTAATEPSTTTSSTASVLVSLHSSASELNPTVTRTEGQTMIYVFAGILAFFAILVIILVSLFLAKHRRRSDDDTLTMYTRGQSMMTENVAYRRQPVSCENSYNMQQGNIKLTPPPQVSLAYQGVLSPLAPHSAAPLLGQHQGYQQFRHGPILCHQASAEGDTEVYDRIDDRGVVPSIYMDGTNKPQFSAAPPPSSSSSSSSSHPVSNLTAIASPGYVPMTPTWMIGNQRSHPIIPSSPPIFGPDVGVYLVPQEKKEGV